MKLQTPANFNAPMKKNTAATAGMIIRKRSSAPSLADAKIVFKNRVLGVKRGNSVSSTFLYLDISFLIEGVEQSQLEQK